MEFVEGIDPDEPGVRRVPWSSVGENPPEVRAHIARKEAIRERKANRRYVHPQRKPPLKTDGLLVEPSAKYPFSLDDALLGGVQMQIDRLRIFRTGLQFDLAATSLHEDTGLLGDRLNLTHRMRPPAKHRIYLGLVLPTGKVVSNKESFAWDAPEDDDATTPWLYGGGSYSRPTETGATYFLSPLPESGPITFSIAYTELGLNTAPSVSIDLEHLLRVEEPDTR
ncbi:hypothetical protein [Rhodococcoides yunnanense]|uniref:hypothetical protein n=1 Tax=Rhodococcoides yunnanense TaxID=278209 RepID=UPI000AED9D49|nr:hypothetical protein [Rhodococcus yunnanensis]